MLSSDIQEQSQIHHDCPNKIRPTNHVFSEGHLKELCEAAVDGVVGVAHLHRAVHQADKGPGQEIVVNIFNEEKDRNQLFMGVHSILGP